MEAASGGWLGVFQEIADPHYSDTPELSGPEEVFVAGNDHVCQTADRAFKHTIVIWVLNDGCNDGPGALPESDAVRRLPSTPSPLPPRA